MNKSDHDEQVIKGHGGLVAASPLQAPRSHWLTAHQLQPLTPLTYLTIIKVGGKKLKTFRKNKRLDEINPHLLRLIHALHIKLDKMDQNLSEVSVKLEKLTESMMLNNFKYL